MAKTRVLHASSRTIFSRFFFMGFVLWVIATFLITTVGIGFVQNSPGVNYEIPNSAVSSVFQFNYPNITYTAQNFNQFGEGISGTVLYYNFSAMSGSSIQTTQFVSGGYAGETNSSGFIHLTFPIVTNADQYRLDTHFTNSATRFDQNSSSILSTTTYYGVSPGNIAMSPVESLQNPGTFALHIWAPFNDTYKNASAFYQSAPILTSLYSYPSFFNKSRTMPIAMVNLTGQENIQTGIKITDHTYYYLAGIENNAGTTEGITFFQSVPTPTMQAVQSIGTVFGISNLMAIFLTFFVVIALSTNPEHRKKWLERQIPEGYPDSNEIGNATMFLHRLVVTIIASIPIVSVTALFAYFASKSQFGGTPGLTPVLVSAAGMFLSIAMSAAYISFLLGKGSVKAVPRDSVLFEKYNRRMMLVLLPLVGIEAIFFDFNFSGFMYSSVSPSIVVTANYFNPFDYLNPLLQMLGSSVTFGYPYTFSPSAYGLSYLTILTGAIFWFTVLVILPYFSLRRIDRKINVAR